MPARLVPSRALLGRTAVAAVGSAVFLALRVAAPEPLTAAGVLATVVAAAPLGWGRHRPLPALAIALAGAAAVAALDEPDLGVPLVGVVLAFRAAVRAHPQGTGGEARLTPVAAVAALGVAAQVAATGLHASPPELVVLAVAGGVCCALAVVAGDNVRRRRQHVADLEERVAGAGRERVLEVRAALSTERLRIAREMHDVLAHGVSLVVVQAAAAQRVVRRDAQGAHDALVGIEDTARAAMVQLRAVLDVLRRDAPDGPDPTPTTAPQPTLAELPALVVPPARFVERGDRPLLPAHVELAAYRIVQEALTNVRRHAPGASARVEVVYTADEVRIEVVDDGTAAAGAPGVAGHGLVGMRERAASCGGVVRAGPRAGLPGWRVLAVLPNPAVPA